MSVEVLLNNEYFFFKNVPFYRDNVTINCSIDCGQETTRNNIVLWAVDPRTNISNIMYISNIIFDSAINNDECFGILETELFLCYHNSDIIMIPMEITTSGKKILQFVIHFPKREETFLREIKLLKRQKFKEFCFICYEEKDNNVFVDGNHHFCYDCIMKFQSKTCPICRQPMTV